MISLVLGWLATAAAAAPVTVPVSFSLTPASSQALVQLLYGVNVADAACRVEVIRPVDLEPALETDQQKLTCQWDSGQHVEVVPFTGSRVDSWGQRRDPRSFELLGGISDSLFKKFQAKTQGMPSPEPDDSMWTRIYLCDPFGVTCLQTVFLNTEPSKDAAGQIACSRNSSLVKEGDVAVDPAAFESYPDYLDALVSAQIEAGYRTIDKVSCVFIAP